VDGRLVGRWDGDTLVIDTTKLIEDSWLGADGWFHGRRCTSSSARAPGRHAEWSATVEDPGVFTKPWEMDAADDAAERQSEGAPRGGSACLEQDARTS